MTKFGLVKKQSVDFGKFFNAERINKLFRKR